MLDLDALRAEVARNRTVDGSAIVLFTALLAEIEANKGDPVAIQAIVDEFRTDNDAFAAAIVANTPGGPVVPPPDPAAARSARR